MNSDTNGPVEYRHRQVPDALCLGAFVFGFACVAVLALAASPLPVGQRILVAGLCVAGGILTTALAIHHLRRVTVCDGRHVMQAGISWPLAEVIRVEEGQLTDLIYQKGKLLPVPVPHSPGLIEALRNGIPATTPWIGPWSLRSRRWLVTPLVMVVAAWLSLRITAHVGYWVVFGNLPTDRVPQGLEGAYRRIERREVADPGPEAGEEIGIGPLSVRIRPDDVLEATHQFRGAVSVGLCDGSRVAFITGCPTLVCNRCSTKTWPLFMRSWMFPKTTGMSHGDFLTWACDRSPEDYGPTLGVHEVCDLFMGLFSKLRLPDPPDAQGYRVLVTPRMRGFWRTLSRKAASEPVTDDVTLVSGEHTYVVRLRTPAGGDGRRRLEALVGSAAERPALDAATRAHLRQRALARRALGRTGPALLFLVAAMGSDADADPELALDYYETFVEGLTRQPAAYTTKPWTLRSRLETMPSGPRRDALLRRLRERPPSRAPGTASTSDPRAAHPR